LCFGNDYELIFKSVGIKFKQPSKDLNLIGSTLIIESHEDDASMWSLLSIYFFTKVFVVCNQNPFLIISFLNHVIVFNSTGLIKYGKDFMSFIKQPGSDSRACAFIHKKTHLYRLDCQRHELGITKRSCGKQKTSLNILGF
jgi:hypothetical protein